MATDNVPAIIASPSEVLEAYLDAEDYTYIQTPRSLAAFVVDHWILPVVSLGLLLAGLAIVGVLALDGSTGSGAYRFLGALLIMVGLVSVLFGVRWMLNLYTRYVITPVRVIRMHGFWNREAASIPWAAITDVNIKTTPLGRLLDYGTIKIETANEASSFRELEDVPRPGRFLEEMNRARAARTSGQTPLSKAGLKALVALEQVLSGGGLVVRPGQDRSWTITRSAEAPSSEEPERQPWQPRVDSSRPKLWRAQRPRKPSTLRWRK
jgi:membrane protein YdbS with pleckstrin-like domain